MRWEYPIFSLDDIKVNMNHYGGMSYEKTIAVWENRVKRINWNDIIVAMCTENLTVLRDFDKLPYKKKACFVPFETDILQGIICQILEEKDYFGKILIKLQLVS